MTFIEGALIKMPTTLEKTVQYTLKIGAHALHLNALLGKMIAMEFTGRIVCTACGKATKKSFSQGHCFHCFRTLACCDICIIKPELCHFARGTCRQPAWGMEHCLKPHVVYLANTSGVKVGVTRLKQIPTRWIDQGAVQALVLYEVDERLHAGQLEDYLKAHVADKTHWRAMLKGNLEPIDLKQVAQSLHEHVQNEFKPHFEKRYCDDAQVVNIQYPVDRYPQKISSLSFDKTKSIQGVLLGMKGQYLILDTGVINMRNFSGYCIKMTID
jgi:hypothetical protein